MTALQEIEHKFRVLSETTAAAVVIYQEQRLVFANRNAEILTGYPQSDLLAMRFPDLVHPEHRARVVEKVLAPPPVDAPRKRHEFKIVTKGGAGRWVEFTSAFLEIDGAPAGLATLYDITDMRDNMAALLDIENNYREIFECSVEGIYQFTRDAGLSTANPSLAQALGYSSPRELVACIADVDRQLFADPARHAALFQALAAHGSVHGFEAQLRRKDGGTLWASINANALFNGDLSLHSYTAFLEDISQRRMLEAQLVQAQKMEAVGRLAGGIAHDFNNILAVITGYCELLRDSLPPETEGGVMVQEVADAARRAAMLTQQLLAFEPAAGRPEGDPRRERRRSFDGGDAHAPDRGEHRAHDHPLPQPVSGQRRPAPDRADPAEPRRQRARRHAGGRAAFDRHLQSHPH